MKYYCSFDFFFSSLRMSTHPSFGRGRVGIGLWLLLFTCRIDIGGSFDAVISHFLDLCLEGCLSDMSLRSTLHLLLFFPFFPPLSSFLVSSSPYSKTNCPFIPKILNQTLITALMLYGSYRFRCVPFEFVLLESRDGAGCAPLSVLSSQKQHDKNAHSIEYNCWCSSISWRWRPTRPQTFCFPWD